MAAMVRNAYCGLVQSSAVLVVETPITEIIGTLTMTAGRHIGN